MESDSFRYALIGYVFLACYCLAQISCQLLDREKNSEQSTLPHKQISVNSESKLMGLQHYWEGNYRMEWWDPNPFTLNSKGTNWILKASNIIIICITFIYFFYRILRRSYLL